MSDKEPCLYLISGDPLRPCAAYLGHKGQHMDRAQLDRARDAMRQRREENPEKYKQLDRDRYYNNPVRREYALRFRKDHPEYAQRQIDSARERRKFWQEIADTYKLERGCECCGYREDAIALDFDHLDPASKLANVSALTYRLHTNDEDHFLQFLAEIEKCRVLCANCHRIATRDSKHYTNKRS